jgi:chaperonin GroEL
MPSPAVLTSPHAFNRLKEGFNTLAELLALTLGPVGGVVLSSTDLRQAPEPLNDAAVIARRLLELPDRGQNVGAMLMRNLVWRVHQRVGDGSAITAVLASALLDHASQCVVAGAHPVAVQEGIRRGVKAAVGALKAMSLPVKNEADLVAIAQAVTKQTDLSLVLGEMFDLLGEHAYITVENYLAPYLEREYLNGGRWKASLVSPYLITAQATRKAILSDPWMVIYDGDLSNPTELGGLFDLARTESQSTKKPFHLFLFARNISGDALNTLVTAHVQGSGTQETGLRVVAVKAGRAGENHRNDMADLAALTGAEVISSGWGRSLSSIVKSDLGRARRVEASAEELLVVGGRGDQNILRSQIQTLQIRLQALGQDGQMGTQPSEAPIDELNMRLARFSGSTAVLKIGAASKTEREILRQKADQGIKALKAALEEGVVPGGGIAYTRCIKAVEALQADHEDEQMGIQSVTRALEAPFKQILMNAGVDASGMILADIREQENSYVYDVIQKEIVPAREAGMLDPTMVLRVALETAASGATLGLSTGVVILKRKPKISYEP